MDLPDRVIVLKRNGEISEFNVSKDGNKIVLANESEERIVVDENKMIDILFWRHIPKRGKIALIFTNYIDLYNHVIRLMKRKEKLAFKISDNLKKRLLKHLREMII